MMGFDPVTALHKGLSQPAGEYCRSDWTLLLVWPSTANDGSLPTNPAQPNL